MNIQVAVVAKHRLMGSALAALLETMKSIRVVAIVRSADEVAKFIRSRRAAIFLIDEDAVKDKADLFSGSPQTSSDISLILLVGEPMRSEFWRTVPADAVNMVLKDASTTELYRAIKSVHAGGRYVSRKVAEYVMDSLTERRGATTRDLTPRQLEILRLLAQGYATKEIADRLNLSPRTIESHRSRIMERVGVRHLAGLIQYAIRMGIITPD